MWLKLSGSGDNTKINQTLKGNAETVVFLK